MKHIFYISQNASESLGLEKILAFYNIIALEQTDAIEDLTNDGSNVIVVDDFSAQDFSDFVNKLSYGEKPFVLSSSGYATVKLSQLYDWEIQGIKDEESPLQNKQEAVLFSVYKKGETKVFGNIHKKLMRQYRLFNLEILDWSHNYVSQVHEIVSNMNDYEDGYTTVQCNVDENGIIHPDNKFRDALSNGIDTYTRLQIMAKEVPFVLYTFFDDPKSEDKLNFHDGYDLKDPESQTHEYNFTTLNIKTPYEIVIKSDMPSGVWKYGGDSTGKIEKNCLAIYPIDEEGDKSLCLLHRGSSIYDIVNQEGVIINTRRKGTKLKAGDTVASIKIPASVVSNSSQIYGWVYEMINAILHYQLSM